MMKERGAKEEDETKAVDCIRDDCPRVSLRGGMRDQDSCSENREHATDEVRRGIEDLVGDEL